MIFLIVAATPSEIGPLLDSIRNNDEATADMAIDILITGVGLVASTYAIQKQIQLKRPDILIQAGIAGCFDQSISLGTVVTISKDRIADEGVIEAGKFKSMIDLGFADADKFPYQQGWLVNPNTDLIEQTDLTAVNAISINQVTTTADSIKAYQDLYTPVTESMEGAALHYVCLMENLPFIQLRAISNYIGERDKSKWKIKESVSRLNIELIRLLQLIH